MVNRACFGKRRDERLKFETFLLCQLVRGKGFCQSRHHIDRPIAGQCTGGTPRGFCWGERGAAEKHGFSRHLDYFDSCEAAAVL